MRRHVLTGERALACHGVPGWQCEGIRCIGYLIFEGGKGPFLCDNRSTALKITFQGRHKCVCPASAHLLAVPLCCRRLKSTFLRGGGAQTCVCVHGKKKKRVELLGGDTLRPRQDPSSGLLRTV